MNLFLQHTFSLHVDFNLHFKRIIIITGQFADDASFSGVIICSICLRIDNPNGLLHCSQLKSLFTPVYLPTLWSSLIEHTHSAMETRPRQRLRRHGDRHRRGRRKERLCSLVGAREQEEMHPVIDCSSSSRGLIVLRRLQESELASEQRENPSCRLLRP